MTEALVPGIALRITAVQEVALATAVEARFVERVIDALQGPVAEGPPRDEHRVRYRVLIERARTLGFASEYDVAIFAMASDRFGDGFEQMPETEPGRVAATLTVPVEHRVARLVQLLEESPQEHATVVRPGTEQIP
jgi:hypothetical protein